MNTSPSIDIATVTIIRIETDERTGRTEVVHAKTLDSTFPNVIKSSDRTAPTTGPAGLAARILTEQLWKLLGHRVELVTVPEGRQRGTRIISVRDLGIDPEFDAADARIQKLPPRPPVPPKEADTDAAFAGTVRYARVFACKVELHVDVPGYGIIRFHVGGDIDITGLAGAEVMAYGASSSEYDQLLRLTKIVHGDDVRE
jgi:hypothetical protein